MTNRKLIIQKNNSYPISDTPKTLFLVRLAWLLNKKIIINKLPEQFKIGETPEMLLESVLPDDLSIELIKPDLSLSEIPESIAIGKYPEQITMELSQ